MKYSQAKDYLNEGKYREAVECFQKAIDITPQMARDVIQACRDRNIDCIVAPYEGNAWEIINLGLTRDIGFLTTNLTLIMIWIFFPSWCPTCISRIEWYCRHYNQWRFGSNVIWMPKDSVQDGQTRKW